MKALILAAIRCSLIFTAAFYASSASAAQILETNLLSGTVGEYTTSGTTINASLISGLNSPVGLATVGGSLFVSSFNNGNTGAGTIGVYTTSGTTVNGSLVSGLNQPAGTAVAGGLLYVANFNSGFPSTGTIGVYNATTG